MAAMNTTPSNRLSPLSSATFGVTKADRARAKRAGVPGLMHCAKCGLDHLDPALAGTRKHGLTMQPDSKGWVCAPGYGCGDEECNECGLRMSDCICAECPECFTTEDCACHLNR